MRRNRALKLLSLALALAAWFALGAEEQVETTLQMNLEMVNIPKDLMVVSEVPAQIEVRVQGRRSLIRELTTLRLNKRLDLAGYKEGTQVFPLSPYDLDLPKGITVTRIRPNAVTISLDHALVRRLEIHPVIQGKPAPGYRLEGVELNPEVVEVRGPKKDLMQLNVLRTTPIDISNLTASVNKEVDLDFQKLPLSIGEKKPVVARITIRSQHETRVLSNVKIVPSFADGPVRLFPDQANVTVRGPAAQLQDLQSADVAVTVSLKNYKPGRHRLKVNVTLPGDLEVVKIQPAIIRVHLLPPGNPS